MNKPVQKISTYNTFRDSLKNFLKKHKQILLAAAIFLVTTASFLWPMVTHIKSYSDGGDHMFNAWTLARNHNCLLRQSCESYSDGNIFFPNEDSMLYSETQFSTGLLTLPLRLIDDNPLFSVNVWYLVSAFSSALFMYMLVFYLSRGNQPFSILAGLLFEFAPTKISAMSHLQSLSIFYLPLIILLLLKYRDTAQKRYLGLFILFSSLLFLASWYQMVFGLVVIGAFIVYVLVTEHKNRFKGWYLAGATAVAIMTTLPLGIQYMRFSKANDATFSIGSQVFFSSGIYDYFTPYEHTPLGSLYYELKPPMQRNAYNSDNYSYAGVTLYALLAFCLVAAYRNRKKVKEKAIKHQTVLIGLVFLAGFIFSLGPLIKIRTQYLFDAGDLNVVVPAPYILVDKFLPQLSFIRAIGRATIICLFALCLILAIFALYTNRVRSRGRRCALAASVIVLVVLDVLPVYDLLTKPFKPIPAYSVNYSIPDVYKFIKSDKTVDNIIILRTKPDYEYAGIPHAAPEDVMWSGYHNKKIFNGYSGYYPPDYDKMLGDFIDLQANDRAKMQALGLEHVLIDKYLSYPEIGLEQRAKELLSNKVYEDSHYVLYKI